MCFVEWKRKKRSGNGLSNITQKIVLFKLKRTIRMPEILAVSRMKIKCTGVQGEFIECV